MSPSQYLTILSFPTDQKRWLPGSKATCMTLSSCAKRDRWQSPKSRPQILTFLSAEQVTISFESDEMSSARTGSYREAARSSVIECEMDPERGRPGGHTL